MQTREHGGDPRGALPVTKEIVAGVKMGLQLAIGELYGDAVGNAFARRLNPEAPDWQYPTGE